MIENKDIPRLAAEIAGRYRGKDNSLSLRSIAKAEGIRLIENRHVNELSPGEYGKSLTDGYTWIIIYDDLQPTVVSRFTVAHELGHYFLKHDEEHRVLLDKIEKIKDKHGRRVERQADLFARCLLSIREKERT